MEARQMSPAPYKYSVNYECFKDMKVCMIKKDLKKEIKEGAG